MENRGRTRPVKCWFRCRDAVVLRGRHHQKTCQETKRKTSCTLRKQPMDRQIIDLYDNFTHGRINRRDFFDRLTVMAGSAAAASSIYMTLKPNYAHAAIVAEDDPRLISETIAIDTPAGKLSG